MKEIFELIKRYKTDELTELEKKKVEEELDKHRLLNEIVEDEFNLNFPPINLETEKGISKEVSHRFKKSTIISVMSAVVIVSVFSFLYRPLISPLVSSRYYNPGKTEIYPPYKDLYHDLMIYLELTDGEKDVFSTIIDDHGFADYGVEIYLGDRFYREGNKLTTLSGSIKKGTGNFFEKYNANHHIFDNSNAYLKNQIEASNEYLELLEALEPTNYVSVYLRYKNPITTLEAVRKEQNIDSIDAEIKWFTVEQESDTHPVWGFSPEWNYFSLVNSDNERYIDERFPVVRLRDYLIYYDLLEHEGGDKAEILAKAYEEHYIDMLKYFTYREEFLKVINSSFLDQNTLKRDIRFFEENGVRIDGLLLHGTAEEVTKYIKTDSNIIIRDIRNVVLSKYSK